MKFFLVAVFLAAATAASLPALQPAPEYPQEFSGDAGSYLFSFQTGDGIPRGQVQAIPQIGEEIGYTNRAPAYSIAPDGQRSSLTFVADENRILAELDRDHLPTPPPLPEPIARYWYTVRTPVYYAPIAYSYTAPDRFFY